MIFQGEPMWMSYLREVDAVPEAVNWAVNVETEKPRVKRSAIDT